MIYFITPDEQIWIIHNLIDRLDEDLRSTVKAVSYHDFHHTTELVEGTVIFTGLGVLTNVQRDIAIEITEQLIQSELTFTLMNHPEKALGRFDLLNVLYDKGFNSFQAYRLSDTSPDDLHFPLFLREEHNHTGSISDIITNQASLKNALEDAAMRGFKKESLLAVEYLDTSDETGLFKKYSALKFGGQIIPRYLSLDYHWVVKENSELPTNRELYTESLIQEEVRFVQENPHQEKLLEIFNVAGIDFGRIDYGLKNGTIQTWEINTLPTFGGFPGATKKNPKRKKRDESKQIFYELLSQVIRESLKHTSSNTGSFSVSNHLQKRISKEKRKQAWVNAALAIGKKMPRLPLLGDVRSVLRRKVRQHKER